MTSPRSDAVYVADLAPNVQFSSSVTVPTLIKVRKKVEIPGLPLKLSAGLDYNFEKEDVNWVASLKEKVLGGKVTLDLNGKTVNYRKNFSVENGPSFCMQVRCPYTGGKFAPTVGINLVSGRGKRRIMSVGSNSFDVRTKLPISRRLRAEVCGNVKLPTLRPQYTLGSGDALTAFDCEGKFELHLAEVNAIIYL